MPLRHKWKQNSGQIFQQILGCNIVWGTGVKKFGNDKITNEDLF